MLPHASYDASSTQKVLLDRDISVLTAEFFFCQGKVRKLSWTNIYPSKFLLQILIWSVVVLNPPLANV